MVKLLSAPYRLGLSKRLSPPTPGNKSLEDAVQDLIDSVNFTRRSEDHPGDYRIQDRTFSQERHLRIYRILQEQPDLVMKHADASEVKICLQPTKTSIDLCISDNKKGFVVQNSPNGFAW